MYTSLETLHRWPLGQTLRCKDAGRDQSATSKPIGALGHVSRGDLDRALAAVDKGFKTWRKVSSFERGKILRKVAELVRTRADEIALPCHPGSAQDRSGARRRLLDHHQVS